MGQSNQIGIANNADTDSFIGSMSKEYDIVYSSSNYKPE